MDRQLKELARYVRRAMAGKTQTWLAKEAKTTNATISRLLNAKNVPTPETLTAVAEVLGLDPLYLMKLAGIPVPNTNKKIDPSAAYIARRLSELPDDVREEVIDVVGAQIDIVYAMMERQAQNKDGTE